MQRKWALRWGVFLAVTVVGFGLLEGPAVVDPASGDTLSEFIRAAIAARPALAAVFAAVLAWFAVHILWKK